MHSKIPTNIRNMICHVTIVEGLMSSEIHSQFSLCCSNNSAVDAGRICLLTDLQLASSRHTVFSAVQIWRPLIRDTHKGRGRGGTVWFHMVRRLATSLLLGRCWNCGNSLKKNGITVQIFSSTHFSGSCSNSRTNKWLFGKSNRVSGSTHSLPRVINVKFPLQPHQIHYIPQYEELGFS